MYILICLSMHTLCLEITAMNNRASIKFLGMQVSINFYALLLTLEYAEQV